MGLFDDVEVTVVCPRCGFKSESFQSKDGDCFMLSIKPEEVGNFYGSCGGCQGWLECYRDNENAREYYASRTLDIQEIDGTSWIVCGDRPAPSAEAMAALMALEEEFSSMGEKGQDG